MPQNIPAQVYLFIRTLYFNTFLIVSKTLTEALDKLNPHITYDANQVPQVNRNLSTEMELLHDAVSGYKWGRVVPMYTAHIEKTYSHLLLHLHAAITTEEASK